VRARLIEIVIAGALIAIMASPAIATTDSCETYCARAAQQSQERCVATRDVNTCAERLSIGMSMCTDQCNAEVTLPSIKGLRAMAQRQAAAQWGADVRLFDEQVYLSGDENARTRLFVFARGNHRLDKDAVLLRLAAGANATDFDEKFACVEMGATLDMPPIVAFWDGLPLEYIADAQYTTRLREDFGDRDYRMNRRFRSAVFPLFEYDANGGRFFVDGRSRQTSDRVKLRRNENAGDIERQALRRESVKRLWMHELATLGQ